MIKAPFRPYLSVRVMQVSIFSSVHIKSFVHHKLQFYAFKAIVLCSLLDVTAIGILKNL